MTKTANGRKAAVFLWFDEEAEAASEFYAATFSDSRIVNVTRTPDGVPGMAAGRVQVVEMTICGIPYALLNAGPPAAPPNDTSSLQIYAEDQAETDRLWDAVIGQGGEAILCGWCRDRWGYRWQITPRALMEALSDPDRQASARVQAAMMTMRKIDIALVEAARRGL